MPELKHPSKPPAPDRPPIWVDGRQQPRFDLRVWAKVGQAMARRWLVPQPGTASGQIAGLGGQIAGGRFGVNLSWLGKAQRCVPSRCMVSRTMVGIAARVAEAQLILDPGPAAIEPLAYPNLIRAKPAPAVAIVSPSPAPHPNPAEEEPTLNAIRVILRTLPQTEVAPARPAAPIFVLPNKKTATSRPGLFLERTLSRMIAWSSQTLALPVGLTQAMLFHLNGGDLADWD